MANRSTVLMLLFLSCLVACGTGFRLVRTKGNRSSRTNLSSDLVGNSTKVSCPTGKQVLALPGFRRWCGDCPKCDCGPYPHCRKITDGKNGPLCTKPLDDGGECYLAAYPSGAIGGWQGLNFLTGKHTYSATHGTSKSNAAQKTGLWSSEVTSTVTAGVEVSPGILGAGGKFTAEASLSAGLRAELSHSYSKEWTMNKEETYTIEFPEDKGFLWQWVIQIKTNDGKYLQSKTRDYAITAGKWEKPRCLPGYGTDAPRYQKCYSKSTTLPAR